MPKRLPRAQAEPPGGIGTFEGAPWYVKLVIWLLAWFGFPVVISVVLLMVLIGYLPSPLTTLDKNMASHIKDMDKVLEAQGVNQRVMRQICRNTSRDAVERVECDR